MVNSILESLMIIWDYWNIEGVILLSLSLHIVLLLFAPFRKSTSNKYVILTIWLAYLVANWVAGFGFGLIAERARHTTDPSVRGIENNQLLALWAVFLLLHQGGPDTITAFSQEDNELWLRHFLGFVIQVVTSVYILLRTLPGNKLFIPTLLVFIAGFIKCFERILALYLASMEKFQESTLREFRETQKLDINNRDIFEVGCLFFRIFKGILVDLIPSFKDTTVRVPSFSYFSSAEALEIFEVQLKLAYEVLHTKVKVTHSLLGIVLRFISFESVLAALSIFHFQVEKQGFHEFDVGVTYTLFLGAIAHDILAFFMLVPSDWTFVSLQNSSGEQQQSKLGKLKTRTASILHWITILKSPRWDLQGSGRDEVLATPFMLKRWSGSVSRLSLIRYMLKARASRVRKIKNHLHLGLEKIILHLGLDRLNPGLAIDDFICSSGIRKIFQKMAIATNVIIAPLRFIVKKAIDLFSDILYEIKIKTSLLHKPLPRELWVLIFNEIKRKASNVDVQRADVKKIFSAKGDCTLRELDTNIALQNILRDCLGTREHYGYSIFLWHIVTELLYYTAEQNSSDYCETWNAGESSKIISEYMLYLLQSKPTLLHVAPTVAKLIFQDGFTDDNNYPEGEIFNLNPEKFLCQNIITKQFLLPKLFSDARKIAKELGKLEEDKKWEIVSKVWVEKLSYAAIHCSTREHVKQVSNGGELITFVWLLLHHYNLANPKFTD